MAERQHVLVVDDEEDICRQIETYLSEAGYRVSSAGDGQAMRRVVEAGPVDLILLDVRLPGEDGLSIARDYLSHTDIPFIMLTSRDQVTDTVAGLEIGAEDYVPKPFHLRELLARVRTVLRRRSRQAEAAQAEADPAAANALRFSGWTLDLMARTLTSRDSRRVALTTQEFSLLAAFVHHPNQALSRDELLEAIAERKWQPDDRAIDVLIGRLRRKIEPDPKSPRLIQTVRGTGYIFTGEVSPV